MIVNITNLSDFKIKHVEFIKRVAGKLGAVIDSEHWEEEVSATHFQYARGLNGAEICKLVRSGADDKKRNADGDIDLDLHNFYKAGPTIAYTYLGESVIWLNSFFLEKNLRLGLQGEANLAGTIIHELSHRAYDFTHPIFKFRNFSVPYKLGGITSKCYFNIYSLPFRPQESLVSSLVFKVAC